MDNLTTDSTVSSEQSSSTIYFSLFFLTQGYENDSIGIKEDMNDFENEIAPAQKAIRLISNLRDVQQMTEAAMASAQQAQEAAANKSRPPSAEYRIGDEVRLNKRYFKQMDHAKSSIGYTNTEVIDSHTYRLDVPRAIHNVFHTRLLATNSLASQI